MAQTISFRLTAEGFSSFAAELKQIETSGEAGARAVERLTAASPALQSAMQRAQQATDQQTVALQRYSAANTQAAQSGGQVGNAMASLGQQVQDATIQLQMGTNALTVLAQQGSQFLGIFGTTGAIAGAGLALGAVGLQLVGLASQTETLAQATDRLGKAYDDVKQDASEWHSGMKTEAERLLELQAYYASLTGAVKAFERARIEAARNDLLRTTAPVVSRVTGPGMDIMRRALSPSGGFDQLTGEDMGLAGQMDPRTATFVGALQTFQNNPLTNEAAAELFQAMTDLARGSDDIASAARTIRERVDAAREDVRRLERTGRDLAGQQGAIDGILIPLPPAFIPPQGVGGGRGEREDTGRDGQQFLDDERRAQEEARRNRERERAEIERNADRQIKRLEDQIDRTTAQYSQQLSNAVADGLFNGFREGESFWDGFARIGRRALQTAFAGGLDTLFIRPTLAPIVGGFMGNGGGGMLSMGGGVAGGAVDAGGGFMNSPLINALGLGRSAFGMSGIGDTLGLGGLGNSVTSILNTQLFGAAAQGATEAGLPLALANNSGFIGGAPGLTIGGALSGVGLGFGAGSLVSGFLANTRAQSTNGRIGAGVGALAGTAIGGPIGGLIGGAVGGLASLLGPNNSFSGGDAILGVDGAGNLTVSGFRGKNFEGSAELVEAAQGQTRTINAAIAQRGLRFSGGGMAGFVGGGQSPNPRDALTAIQATGWAIPSLQASDPAIQRMLNARRGDNRSLDTVLSEVDWIKNVYEPMLKTVDGAADFERSLSAVSARFDEAIQKATFLGQETDKLTEARDREIDRLRQQRAEQWTGIADNLNIRRARVGGDNLTADLIGFDAQSRAERQGLADTLRGLGADPETTAVTLGNLERLLADERLAIQKRYADQAIGIAEQQGRATVDALTRSAGDLFRSLTYGNLSSLAPESRYFAAVSDLRNLQRSGDIESYIRVAPNALSAARDFLGTSEAYGSLVSEVSRFVSTAAPGSDNGLASLLEASVSVTEQYGSAQVTELVRLNGGVDALRAEFRALSARIDGLVARAA